MQYTLLFDWMLELTDDGLTLAEAITYSVIYSFSRDGNGSFLGSYAYLSRLTGSSRRQQIRILKSLVNKGLVIKLDGNSIKPNEYKCNLSRIPEKYKASANVLVDKGGSDKMTPPVTNETNSSDILSPHINKNNKNKLIFDNVDKSTLSHINSKNNKARTDTHKQNSSERQLNFAEAGAFEKEKHI